MRYKNNKKNKKNGVVYTPTEMADFVSGLMIDYKLVPKNSNHIEVLDPAAGEGELLIAMTNRLLDSGVNCIKIVGYETDEAVANNTQKLLESLFPNLFVEIRVGDFLTAVETGKIEKFDYVIANPPYIRTQILGSNKAQSIAEKLGLTGRVDIYYAFLVYAKTVLKDTGVAGYITSNKFMSIKSGYAVRRYMLENYSMHRIIDLGDTKLFAASVLPCILIFSLGNTTKKSDVHFTTAYEVQFENQKDKIKSVFDVINGNGSFTLENGKSYTIQQGEIRSIDPKSTWGISTSRNSNFMRNVEQNTWHTFSELGKIRVGIKTTADNVFIGEDWASRGNDIELLRPLITHRNAGQIIAGNEQHWKVLYTHQIVNGKKTAVNLDNYPNAKKYLEGHFEQLNKRNYLKNANRNWYEIWVPQNPDAWSDRKIIFRDIAEKPQFWLDETGAVVNGDCYWIDIKSSVNKELIYLALAIANSSFIEKFYDIKFNNKLYSGKRRFQSQYVEQFPIPYMFSDLAIETVDLVKKIIATHKIKDSDKKKIDDLVFAMFNCQKNPLAEEVEF